MPSKEDLLNKTYGYFTVVGFLGIKNGRRLWECKCKCGNTRSYLTAEVKRLKSCGCLKIKHGCSNSKNQNITTEYSTWSAIKSRCYDINSKNYKNYGMKGISVCERWLNSFENFLEDMGKKPSKLHSIDRINNEGNYEPTNCRWATAKQQANNRRKPKPRSVLGI